jgi:tripartite-type tricarboxylate transporter receptor subunit TctC
MTDLVTGRVDLGSFAAGTMLPLIKEKQLKAVAVIAPKRSALIPDVPTTDEQGLTGINSNVQFMVLAPAATPKPVIDKLAAEIGRVMATPEFKKKAADLGAAADYLSPAQLGELAQTDLARWAEVAKASKIVAD